MCQSATGQQRMFHIRQVMEGLHARLPHGMDENTKLRNDDRGDLHSQLRKPCWTVSQGGDIAGLIKRVGPHEGGSNLQTWA